MIRVSIDFESASEVDLQKCGAWVYSAHASTHFLCAAWAIDDGEVQAERFSKRDPFSALLELAEREDTIWAAYNVGFEFAMWHNILVKYYGFPELPPERWRDSAAVASMYCMPNQMGDVAKALDLPHQKDEEGKKIMLKMCKPLPENQRKANRGKKWYRKRSAFETLLYYCADDVECERGITEVLGDLPQYEQQIWEADLAINASGIRIDMDLAHALSERKNEVCDDLRARCTKKYGFSPSQVQKIKSFMVEKGVSIPTAMKFKKDKETGEYRKQKVETLGAEEIKSLLVEEIPDEVREVLTWRQEYATTSIAKADAVLRQCVDGVARYQFRYHGANTGRWSGKGIQLHNLPRGEFDEDWVDDEMHLACNTIKSGRDLDYFDISPMKVLKSSLRGLIVPRAGKELTVIDFSQIEARVLPWLAGQQEVLDAFVMGKDLYKFTASQIYEKEYDDVEKPERFIGKTASLALGYQGGAGAFISMATNFGVKVEKDLAEQVKTDWRNRNQKIVKFWYNLEKAAITCVKFGRGIKYKNLRLRMEDGFFKIYLPSGRALHYYKPRIKKIKFDWGEKDTLVYMGSDQQRNIKWGYIGTYGGKLAENVTQAVSRDLLAEAMLRLRRRGFTIIGHVHDELILEGKTGTVDYEEVLGIMTELPKWAKGLPIGADGFQGSRYRK